MESKIFSISLAKNPVISIKSIPGHFTTGNAHTNSYLDVSGIKANAKVARDVAQELAVPYISNTLIETIVCMEKTEIIGAYLAEELMKGSLSAVNTEDVIHIVTPTSNSSGQLIFQDNMIEWILDKHILLLVASISSGKTVKSAMDCLDYYGGKLAGISTLFLSSREKLENEIHTLFTSDDIPGYKLYNTAECEMCKAGQKLDAIVSSDGYIKIG